MVLRQVAANFTLEQQRLKINEIGVDLDAINITLASYNVANWNTAYGWGDHSSAGYLTSYTETDPVFDASPAGSITSTQVTDWDTAYTWGDHSAQGYLTGLDIEDLGNVDITGGLSDQQILKWDASTSSWKPANDLVGGQSAIELADLSVSVAPDGSPNLTYNNTNGVFTYTPPDLSPYLTIETDPVFSASVAFGITSTQVSNWDTAYGWGDHSIEGYLTTETSHTDVVVDGDFTSTGLMKRGAASGSYSIITDNSTNWDTAYGWGDHSTEGYLTVADFGATPPVNANDPGTAGEIRYDSSYIYVCVAASTWKRSPLSTWP